jgi:hypothetical protein
LQVVWYGTSARPDFFYIHVQHLITRLTPGVLLPPDHRHELDFLIPITLQDMTTITVQKVKFDPFKYKKNILYHKLIFKVVFIL